LGLMIAKYIGLMQLGWMNSFCQMRERDLKRIIIVKMQIHKDTEHIWVAPNLMVGPIEWDGRNE